MEIEEGFLLSLKCRVEGDSNPEIRWFKDGVPIDSIHNPNADISVTFQKSQLRIKNMRLSDSGNYSCLGASETSRMSRWVYVTGESFMNNNVSVLNIRLTESILLKVSL
ncbi:Immunoglobulin domain protein [Paragonimus heterotremus]|uniref:Immunoglobulin domain protein n=1 Tax=Paragonimus heterotremus TaxID=100268 RepID=A0A8J4THR3_9TREM|nr:Immunoglobulin domain protein [Paragonimus heterotremus]